MNPLESLRSMLAEDRAAGMSFEVAWPEDLKAALSSVSHSAGWREALEGTKESWRKAWAGLPGPRAGLSRDLADNDHARTARARRPG